MCSDTPRFSYGCLKTVICACPGGPVVVASAVYGELRDGYTGGYRGGLYRVQGSTTQPPREEAPVPAKRARKAHRAWSGGDWGWARVLGCSAAGTGIPHPAGPVGHPLGTLPGNDLGMPPLGQYGEIPPHFLGT